MQEEYDAAMSVQESVYEPALELGRDWDDQEEVTKPEGLYALENQMDTIDHVLRFSGAICRYAL